MVCIRGLTGLGDGVYIGVMTCPPREADRDRTVLEAIPVDRSDRWWTGLVRDRDETTGERRLRLERWVDNGHRYDNPHVWRVRREFWDDETTAVTNLESNGGAQPPGNLPIDQRLSPVSYVRIRRDDRRWVAAVRVDRPLKGECVRLYHWNPGDGTVRQKWTVGRSWSKVQRRASRKLQQVV